MKRYWRIAVLVLVTCVAAAIIFYKQSFDNRIATTSLKFPAVVMFFDSHDRDAECAAIYAAFDSIAQGTHANLSFFKVDKDSEMFNRYRITVLPTVVRFSAEGTERQRIEGEGDTALHGIRSLAVD